MTTILLKRNPEDELDTVVDEFFNESIRTSWTWERLTTEEKQRFFDLSNMLVFDRIKGTAKSRMEQVNSIYTAFLAGVGYDGFNWRSEDKK